MLPLQPTPLVGRDSELEWARQQLRSPNVRLLTITGTAGAGKTRLAIALAASIGARAFADLAAIRDPDLVLPAIARALGLREQRGEPARTRLVRHIRDRRMLLILDNLEQVLDAAPAIADLLTACANLTLVVTSRAPLRLRWEHVLPTAPLAVPDPLHLPRLHELREVPAVALYLLRARAVHPSFELTAANAHNVAELCVRLDGLPLAIELAAARSDVATPREVLHQLASLGEGPRDLPARHQSLRAAFDWSYDLLDPSSAALFRRLAVFVGGVAPDVVASAGGDNTVSTLVRHSLLRREVGDNGEARFRMLETVRSYALERLEQAGERESAARSHAEYMLRLAEETAPALFGPRQAASLERLEREHDNLAAALRWTLESGEIGWGLRLAKSLWRFCWLHGHLSEGMTWLDNVVAGSVSVEGDLLPLRAAVLNGTGVLAHVLGAYDRAAALLAESLELSRQLGSDSGIAAALHNLGALAREQGDWQRAYAAYADSLALERRAGSRWGIATSLTNLGALAHDRGDDREAETLLEEAVALMREEGDRRGIASALHNLAAVARETGDWPRAAVLHDESLALWRELGDRWGMAVSLHDLARVRQHLGSQQLAAQLLDEALGVFEELGVRQGIATCLEALAEVVSARGESGSAVRLLAAAEALREATHAPLAPRDRPTHARLVQHVRSAMTPAAWRAAWRAGRALSLDAAIGEARLAAQVRGDIPAGARAVLTAREWDVVLLIAEGLTNRQIAERLVISERTADRHVSNILDRLGLTSRAQVVAWAAARPRTVGT